MEALTVKEMISILQTLPQDGCLVVLREGKGHYTAVTKDDVKIKSSVYFGGYEPTNNKYDEEAEKYQKPWIQVGVCP